MYFKKPAPWNWFKKEKEHGSAVPSLASSQRGRDMADSFRTCNNLERMLRVLNRKTVAAV
jgi:hypothetical protein